MSSPTSPRLDRALRDLIARRREPVCAYLYDVAGLEHHARALVDALPDSCRLFYAMKANDDPVLLRALAPVVAGFEAASAGELEKARAAARDAPLLFGGPGKTERELRLACELGVERIHVESLLELRRLAVISRGRRKPVGVLLRVNVAGPLPAATLQMSGGPTQFGIDERQIPDVMRELQCYESLELEGFHFHSLSNNLDARLHNELVATYLRKVRQWETHWHGPLRAINIGGGIGVDYSDTKRTFDWRGFCHRLGQQLQEEPHQRELSLECGRFVTAEWGAYAAEVIDIKSNHGETFAVVRGGTHHFRLPASWRHSHPFRVVPVDDWSHPYDRPGVVDSSVSIAGQLCSPKDVLARHTRVAQLRVGDVVLFTLAGAYGWSISHRTFLSHRPPEVVHVV